MNKTYKVVFNKARGALMAANEITSSVQKKGTKTVIVTAVVSALAMISAGANADNLTRLDNPGSSLSNQTISGKFDFSGWGGYAYIGAKDFSSENNTYSVEGDYSKGDGTFGGAIALYSQDTNGRTLHFDTFKNDKFIGNSLVATGANSEKVAWNAGGAIAVKGHSVTFENVLFQDNKVVSNVSGKGGVAVGGAVFLDKMLRGTESNNVGEKKCQYECPVQNHEGLVLHGQHRELFEQAGDDALRRLCPHRRRFPLHGSTVHRDI